MKLQSLKSRLLGIFGLTLTLSGCYVVVDSPYYYDYYYSYPYYNTQCYYDYYYGEICDVYYYNADGSVASVTRDLTSDVAQAEETALKDAGKFYANRFSLSEDQGIKLARNLNDFKSIENRSEQDLADFAKRLYGVEPAKIVAAIGANQAGQKAQMDALIQEAAQNFETTPENMKNIIQSLHGKALEHQGINL